MRAGLRVLAWLLALPAPAPSLAPCSGHERPVGAPCSQQRPHYLQPSGHISQALRPRAAATTRRRSSLAARRPPPGSRGAPAAWTFRRPPRTSSQRTATAPTDPTRPHTRSATSSRRPTRCWRPTTTACSRAPPAVRAQPPGDPPPARRRAAVQGPDACAALLPGWAVRAE